ncbi:MAG: patatin-like phospholipase family protein [Oscillospiraceae bacterium]|nr:patatin-like phospholipase family protein [Oscillospiraceae bacterium]
MSGLKNNKIGRIGLALSGGGMRAAIYHLGVLKYLSEAGLFDNVTSVSSVSGASLCIGALFAINNNKWPSGEMFYNETLPKIREMMLSHDIQKTALSRLPFSPRYWRNRVEIIADVLEKKWGINGTLQDLPGYEDCPRCPFWEINCTTFETGERFRVRRDFMGDRLIVYTVDPNLPISRMIAASAGFPVLIGPYTLKTKNMRWTNDKNGKGDEVAVNPKYTLWDGGVYDNLGLEALYKIGRNFPQSDKLINNMDNEIDFLVVSDASAAITFKEYKKTASLSNMKRLLDISLNQVYALRRREFHASVTEKGKGLYLQIGDEVRHYPTTLSTPCEHDFDRILLNGYTVAGKEFEHVHAIAL